MKKQNGGMLICDVPKVMTIQPSATLEGIPAPAPAAALGSCLYSKLFTHGPENL